MSKGLTRLFGPYYEFKMAELNTSPEPSFEASLDRLQKIVQKLESGDAPLDESLKLFEEGVSVAKNCQEKLSAAEKRVEILVKAPDDTNGGQPVFETFAPNNSSTNKS